MNRTSATWLNRSAKSVQALAGYALRCIEDMIGYVETDEETLEFLGKLKHGITVATFSDQMRDENKVLSFGINALEPARPSLVVTQHPPRGKELVCLTTCCLCIPIFPILLFTLSASNIPLSPLSTFLVTLATSIAGISAGIGIHALYPRIFSFTHDVTKN
jgi:hypothetical protein